MRLPLELRPLLTVAWRDLRSSYARFAFVVGSMALGIAALVGVRGSSESVQQQFLRDTHALLAADVVIQSPAYPTDAQRNAVAQLIHNQANSTLVVETLAMASSLKGRPQIVDVTAVDPAKYPFYGRVVLRPQGGLASVLDRNSLAASQALLYRLNAKLGDKVHVGGQEFRIAAVLVSLPDRLLNENPIALPVLMSNEAFARTGLIQNGNRLSTRYLFKLPQSGTNLDDLRSTLARLFPGTQITDFRRGRPELSEAIDRATAGLSMICLFALVLACAGVAMTMRAHLRERLDAIATIKSLGATFTQILSIYLSQVLLLAILGSLSGIVLGFGLETFLLRFAQAFFTGSIAPSLTWHTGLEAVVTGMLATLLLTFPVLLNIRTIKPLLILRRDVEPETSGHRWRLALFSAPIVVGLGMLAVWLSHSLKIAGYFLAALITAIFALGITAQVVLWAARSFSRITAHVSFLGNYAIKSLARPGNQTIAVLVALGISTGFTLGVFLIQRTILRELTERVPTTIPNLIMAGVTRYERPGLLQLLQQRPELVTPPQLIPTAQVLLVSINGQPAEQVLTAKQERRYLQPRPAAGVDSIPLGASMIQGSWWTPHSTEEAVAVREDVAQRLHLSAGFRLVFQLGTRSLPVTVAAIYRWQERGLSSSFDFMLPSRELAEAPILYLGGIRLKPGTADTVQEAIYSRFPTVTVFNLSDILDAFETITNELTLIVKSLAAFVIAAGIGVLVASVAGDRRERFREIVCLKSIGATKWQIVAMSSLEFLILGLVSSAIGTAFANSFAALLSRRLFHTSMRTEWNLAFIALFATTSLAIVIGWMASYRVLRLRPNEALQK